MRLRFTSRAADELEEVIEYIRERSPQGAKNVRARIHKLTLHVLERPYTGSLTSSGLRRIATTPYPYLIFYEVRTDEAIVVGIRHSPAILRLCRDRHNSWPKNRGVEQPPRHEREDARNQEARKGRDHRYRMGADLAAPPQPDGRWQRD